MLKDQELLYPKVEDEQNRIRLFEISVMLNMIESILPPIIRFKCVSQEMFELIVSLDSLISVVSKTIYIKDYEQRLQDIINKMLEAQVITPAMYRSLYESMLHVLELKDMVSVINIPEVH